MNPCASLQLNRREFLATAAGAATAVAARLSASTTLHAAEEVSPAPRLAGLIDTNVSLGRWPFRRLPLDESPALAAKLRGHGVAQAWAGSFDALLHKDIAAVNSRLAVICRKSDGLFVPMGALNPMLPGWEDDLRRCVEEHRMPGIRLHPNYHGYKLGEPLFERVLALATERNLLVQISLIMEDERTLHPLVQVPATDAAPLAAVARNFPRARLQLLNAFRPLRGKAVIELAAAGVRFEIAMLEGVAGVGKMLAELDADRLLFGSHAPFFYFESALLKLKESALVEAQLRALTEGSARQLLTAR